MSIWRSLYVIVAVSCLCFEPFAARAASPGYDAIYVFGDSYCDVGNIYAATHGQIPLSPPYFHGRFSNGPIWVEHVAGAWGLPMQPSLAGGTDYAVGGAWVTAPQVTPLGTIPSVPQQVALYLSQHGQHADPNALYILEGGGNDILGASGGSAQSLGYQIALGIAGSELLLRRAGAEHFLIPDLLDVGQLPAARANAAFATAASQAANRALDQLLKYEGFLEDVEIYRLDVFSLFHDVAADPTHFGFTDITNPCLNPAPCSDPDHTLFWDAEHPTEFGHAFFAVAVEASLGHDRLRHHPD
ncbi:MAG TPA: SGNH/GDSL hydrolase family protein [Acidobacteriaceae bacterium]|nr:SGNH/GDSL hydrolase family protein [Acidobacteriaceae bacterium]